MGARKGCRVMINVVSFCLLAVLLVLTVGLLAALLELIVRAVLTVGVAFTFALAIGIFSSDEARTPLISAASCAKCSDDGHHELLRPGVIQALGDALLAAQLGDAVIAAQAIEHDPDFLFGRKMPPRRSSDVLHHRFRRGLGPRFCIGGFGSHLRSFVTTTRPKSSLNHNLKSVPWVLTGSNRDTSMKPLPPIYAWIDDLRLLRKMLIEACKLLERER